MSLYMHCRALILAILCGCLLSSCTLAAAPAPDPTAAPTPALESTAPPAPPGATTITSDELAQMEQQWNDQRITSYRMSLLIKGSFVTEQWSITVQGGQVSSATCLSDRCSQYTLVDHASHTVAGLFERTRAALRDGDEIAIVADSTYHFPQQLKIATPHVADAQIGFEITAFEPGSP
jgi:hypothetical protein